jgi:deoxyribonuclease V
MKRLQHDIAETAVFDDEFGFDPAAVGGSTASADTESDSDSPLVAGVDQAFLDDRVVSAVVVSRRGEVVERTHAVTETQMPYVPGLLSFREGDPIFAALATLETDPDLYVIDGSGRLHYRQAGLATHVGVAVDAPAVGVAKSLLCGTLGAEPDGRPAGWRTPIRADGEVDAPDGTVVGYALQTRQYDERPVINPVYVSPGHRVSAATATELVERLCDGYKLPEPTRCADSHAETAKAAVDESGAGSE